MSFLAVPTLVCSSDLGTCMRSSPRRGAGSAYCCPPSRCGHQPLGCQSQGRTPITRLVRGGPGLSTMLSATAAWSSRRCQRPVARSDPQVPRSGGRWSSTLPTSAGSPIVLSLAWTGVTPWPRPP